MIWFKMKRWIWGAGRDSASLFHGLISTFKYSEEIGTELKGFFLLSLISQYDFEDDAWVKKSVLLNYFLYFYAKQKEHL